MLGQAESPGLDEPTRGLMRRRPSSHELATGALVVAIASGAGLAFYFDPAQALDTLSRLELESVAGRAARALHAASAPVVAVFVWLAWFRTLRARASSRAVGFGLALLGLLVLLSLSGLLLRSDGWAELASRRGIRARPGLLFGLHLGAALGLAMAATRVRKLSAAGVTFALGLAALLGFGLPPPLEDPRAPSSVRLERALGLESVLASRTPSATFLPFRLDSLTRTPRIEGRRESCVACHAAVTGLGAGHDPNRIGCVSCHLGAPFRVDAAGAHAGMLRVPGNLDALARTCSRCHAEAAARVTTSLMTRATGIVAVDRFVFAEQPNPDGDAPITALGQSPADTHLGQLCSSCHLGRAKTEPAQLGELSRGGGCVACHLDERSPRSPVRSDPRAFGHPGISLQIPDLACFGCHSRSGRISLTYSGFRETFAPGSARLEDRRTLADGRTLLRVEPDVHHERGLACIDCHTSRETMGDGALHRHQGQATSVRCETCHRTSPPKTIAASELDAATSRIVRLRGLELREHLLVDGSDEPLPHVFPLPDRSVALRGKWSGKEHVARPPAPRCTADENHSRLSCQSCHATRAHRCVGCHTERDASGTWVEYSGEPLFTGPSLGVVSRRGEERIEPFVPGMVLTLNPPEQTPRATLPERASDLISPSTRLVRAYARAVPHSIRREVRSCRECHADPAALGYGEGTLKLDGEHIAFEPKWPKSPIDGLPVDAWIPFLSDAPGVTTRTAQRSLRRAEQVAILTVGVCLGCHDPSSSSALYADFQKSRTRLSAACRVPAELQKPDAR